MPDEGDFPKFEFLDPKDPKIKKIKANSGIIIYPDSNPKNFFLSETTRLEEAEAARQREMAVLRHKRIRAEQAPSGSGAPVGHFQPDYRPPISYPTPSVPGSPRTWQEKHQDEKERQDAKDRWDIFKNNPGSFGA